MKIYFAGSIRGGREDAELYLNIVEFLKGFGEVLTEHIGDLNLSDIGDEGLTDCYIHDRDVRWLLSADVLVAEVTVVSMGVGYEIGRAVSAAKKIICLYRNTPDRKLSAMISGCPDITLIRYDNVQVALDNIKKELNNF